MTYNRTMFGCEEILAIKWTNTLLLLLRLLLLLLCTKKKKKHTITPLNVKFLNRKKNRMAKQRKSPSVERCLKQNTKTYLMPHTERKAKEKMVG